MTKHDATNMLSDAGRELLLAEQELCRPEGSDTVVLFHLRQAKDTIQYVVDHGIGADLVKLGDPMM
jgi:hypothetical protein